MKFADIHNLLESTTISNGSSKNQISTFHRSIPVGSVRGSEGGTCNILMST